jgi:hypothetical protein
VIHRFQRDEEIDLPAEHERLVDASGDTLLECTRVLSRMRRTRLRGRWGLRRACRRLEIGAPPPLAPGPLTSGYLRDVAEGVRRPLEQIWTRRCKAL